MASLYIYLLLSRSVLDAPMIYHFKDASNKIKWPVFLGHPADYTSVLFNHLEAIIVPHWMIWSWYTGRWWVGCYIWYSEDGTGRGRSPTIDGHCTNHRIAV